MFPVVLLSGCMSEDGSTGCDRNQSNLKTCDLQLVYGGASWQAHRVNHGF